MTNIKHCLKIIILQSETMKVMKTETEKHFKKIKTFNNSLIMKLISFPKIPLKTYSFRSFLLHT